ncbi:DNA photolyase N-terminal [Trinorchestia longiramus]|nr:DNA photolyase N-terminal [Trinorchestia longiramus]
MGERNVTESPAVVTSSQELQGSSGAKTAVVLQSRPLVDDLNVVLSRSLVAERMVPSRFSSNYQTMSSMPIMTNKILTGTMIMTDPNAMTHMTMFGDYKLESKSLIPPSMMHVRPMYGDIKSIQGRALLSDPACSVQPMVTDGLVPSERVMTPQLMPLKTSLIKDDMMTGITMISGKPLSGRVMVGDARAVTTRVVTSDKMSPAKTANSDRIFHSRPPEERTTPGSKAVLSPAMPKANMINDKHPPSKLSQIDRMTASRIAGESPPTATVKVEKKSHVTHKNSSKNSQTEKGCKIQTEKHNFQKSDSLDKNILSEQVSSTHTEFLFGENLGFGCENNGVSKRNSMALDRTKSPGQNMSPNKIASPGERSIHRTILGDNNITFSENGSSSGLAFTTEKKNNNKVVSGKHVVHWFRRGLRLHDNPSLKDAIVNCETFRCIYILDPWFAGSSNVGVNKWRFLLQCLEDVDNSLRNLNSRLFVVRGQPANALPQLFKEWNTTVLSFEEDPEPFGRARDASIIGIAQEMGIEVIVRTSHTLYKLDKIIKKKGGKPPLTYKTFQNILAMMDPPAPPVAVIEASDLKNAYTPLQHDHDDKYGVPNLEHLGFETEHLPPAVWKGGETEALSRLKHHLERKAWVASFGRPKMSPQSLFACPTGLSPYLRFGCLSARKFYTELNELYTKIKRVPAPVSLHGHLLWREFFYTAATNNPKFDHMKGNPICVQIPWDKNPEALAKWAHDFLQGLLEEAFHQTQLDVRFDLHLHGGNLKL